MMRRFMRGVNVMKIKLGKMHVKQQFYCQHHPRAREKGTWTCFYCFISIPNQFHGMLINKNKAQGSLGTVAFLECWWFYHYLSIQSSDKIPLINESGKMWNEQWLCRLINPSKALWPFDGFNQFIFQLQIAFVRRQIKTVEAGKRKNRNCG